MTDRERDREPGWYWVRWDETWEVAWWDGELWHDADTGYTLGDALWVEIDERRIETPDEERKRLGIKSTKEKAENGRTI